MFNWILDFLSNQTFPVKVENAVSEDLDIINGIPHGIVVSPILYNITKNDIFVNLKSAMTGFRQIAAKMVRLIKLIESS